MEIIKKIDITFTEEFTIIAGCFGGIVYGKDIIERSLAFIGIMKAISEYNIDPESAMIFSRIASAAAIGSTEEERKEAAKKEALELLEPRLSVWIKKNLEDKDNTEFSKTLDNLFDKVSLIPSEPEKKEEKNEIDFKKFFDIIEGGKKDECDD